VSRPLENLYVCSRIKGLRIHRWMYHNILIG
jgi:hypothetical protein